MHQALDLGGLRRGDGAGASDMTTVPPPRRRWAMRVLLPLGLLAAFGGLLAYAARDALTPAIDVRVVPVVMKAADPALLAASGSVVQAAGWVEPDPYPTHVSALADGVVREVLVLEGERVEADQVVARLVDDEARLAAARAEAELAERAAEVKLAEATLSAARREWENPVERKRAVASAEALLAEGKADLARHPAELAAEQAKARELREEHQRKQAAGAAAVGALELASARLKAEAQDAVVEATAAKRPALEARVQALEAEAEAAREHLRLRIPEAKALAEAEAALARAKAAERRAAAARDEAALRLTRMEVRSPAAGVVLARLVGPGAKVSLTSDEPAAAHVLRLYDPARLQVRVDVPLADAARVSVGQRSEIVVAVLPDRVFRGTVTRAVPEADLQKNTQQFKVSIEDPVEALRPEMLARVKILAEAPASATTRPAAAAAAADAASRQALFVPASAIRRTSETEAQAWVVNQGRSAAALRTIRVAGSGSSVAVVAGLSPGDRLIVGDVSRLREGARVRVTGEAQE